MMQGCFPSVSTFLTEQLAMLGYTATATGATATDSAAADSTPGEVHLLENVRIEVMA